MFTAATKYSPLDIYAALDSVLTQVKTEYKLNSKTTFLIYVRISIPRSRLRNAMIRLQTIIQKRLTVQLRNSNYKF